METVALIPARGGSKGIPRKNIQVLSGKPLLAHTIDSALRASLVGRVIVTTDDPEIGGIAKQFGAEVVWRPPQISDDKASSEAALLHALESMYRIEGYDPDLLVFLQCTSPLTLPEDIDGAIQALLDQDADTAAAVSPFRGFLWRSDDAIGAIGVNHDCAVRPRRQELEPQYLESGAIYVMRTVGFRKTKHRFFGRIALYVLPRERCWEIDEPADLLIAEALMRQRQKTEWAQRLRKGIRAIALDFDGVLTDNRVVLSEDGKEAVVLNRSDGLAVSALKAQGVEVVIISSETNPVVRHRCRKLGLESLTGVKKKLPALREWASRRGIELSRIVYVGNDVNDVPCMQAVGVGVAVADAVPKAKCSARFVLTACGGEGVVRELADILLAVGGEANREQ